MRLIPKFTDEKYTKEKEKSYIIPPIKIVAIPQEYKKPKKHKKEGNKFDWVINFIFLPFVISLISGVIIYFLTR